ncbi:substrate-binding domain-containing protein [Ruminococcus sp. HUN007]|uniref:substrate-binding domain-containing protein n=1 Tax=Ruminococcus sp. HUN007 TaxID=1514668 RepID=UPI0005D2155A|nr:substrate-binding domain-containing protein [Ruminococcus sp. HUN007]
MQKKRLTFGVVAAQASDIEQRRIMEGIIEQAKGLNIDTVVISNIYNPDKSLFTIDCRKENNIYELLNTSGFDGFILIAEAIINSDLQKKIAGTLEKRPEIPVVVVGAPGEDLMRDHFEVINTDDIADTEEITDHMIDCHGCRDIDILTGRPDMEVSSLRVEGYKRSLEKHGIPFDSSKVIYGDFWMTSGKALANQYINGERRKPEAVVCANDYMAYGLLDEFSEHDIIVPDEIRVAGYEYILKRIYHYPVLSTYRRNRFALGAEAVNILYSKINHTANTSRISFRGNFITGDTCGCGICRQEYRNELNEEKDKKKYRFFNLFSDFAERLTVCTSMSDYVTTLSNFTYMVRDLDAMYLCLLEDWYNSEPDESAPGAVMNCYTIKNDFTNEYKTSFVTENDISAILSYCSEPCAYYFNPLFFRDRYFGYIVTVYRNPNTYDSIFRYWLRTVSNALEMLRLKNDLNYLTQCRGLSPQHDTSTGMLNRSGFESAVKRAASSAAQDNSICFIMLKTELFSENIQFENHESRLVTLSEISNIMKSLTLNRNELCGRISENTYAFAAFGNLPDNYAEKLTDKLSCMLLHATTYISEYGTNSFVCISDTFSSAGFDYDTVVNRMNDRIKAEAAERTAQQRLPHFSEFQNLRDSIYLEPSEAHYSDELCQKLCLSTGYFRNIYKKYFGISYHQDCIKSKITLAKYLLCTSSMSITAIASKCGYEDEKYFMRLFQQNTAYTPNRYRMMFQ